MRLFLLHLPLLLSSLSLSLSLTGWIRQPKLVGAFSDDIAGRREEGEGVEEKCEVSWANYVLEERQPGVGPSLSLPSPESVFLSLYPIFQILGVK